MQQLAANKPGQYSYFPSRMLQSWLKSKRSPSATRGRKRKKPEAPRLKRSTPPVRSIKSSRVGGISHLDPTSLCGRAGPPDVLPRSLSGQPYVYRKYPNLPINVPVCLKEQSQYRRCARMLERGAPQWSFATSVVKKCLQRWRS